jgi:hypothetical protein
MGLPRKTVLLFFTGRPKGDIGDFLPAVSPLRLRRSIPDRNQVEILLSKTGLSAEKRWKREKRYQMGLLMRFWAEFGCF